MRTGVRVKIISECAYYGMEGIIIPSNSFLYKVRFNGFVEAEFAITELMKVNL